MIKIKYTSIPIKLQSEIKELNKIQGIDKKLHEIKEEKIVDYAVEFKMVSILKFCDQIRTTHFRFRNIIDYEAYINSIDGAYDSEDAIFNGYFHKINNPQLSPGNRSQYGNGFDLKHEIIEYRRNNCFEPTKGYCFVTCSNFITGEDYKKQ